MPRGRLERARRTAAVGLLALSMTIVACTTEVRPPEPTSTVEGRPDDHGQESGARERDRAEQDAANEPPAWSEAATEVPSTEEHHEIRAELQQYARPEWLGTRVLDTRPNGIGYPQPTPLELRDRRLAPPDGQQVAESAAFRARVLPVSDDVAQRSTWHPGCPVELDELRHVTVDFWGFDGQVYVGELIVHHEVADDIVTVFEQLHAARFPIEEMRIVTNDDLNAPPTGDGNNTTAFVCRSTVQGQRWSEHAYGLAVDINPFHNPYVRGDVVIPELAGSYSDRGNVREGMIVDGDVVTGAFGRIGWGWGGHWRSSTDPMHFSRSGR